MWSAPVSSIWPLVSEDYRGKAIASAPADVKLLFKQDSASDRRALARRYLDLHPDDPTAYFNYAQVVMMSAEGEGGWDGTPASVDEALAALAGGEKLDPCNAYYPLMESALLLEPGVSVEWPTTMPIDELALPPTIKVKNEKDLQAGLAAFRRAAALPMFHAYWPELLSRKLAVVPDASLADIGFRLREEMAVPLPYLNRVLEASNRVSAYAVAQDRPELAGDLHRMSAKLAKDSRMNVELQVALSMNQIANLTDYLIAKANRDEAAAAAARARFTHWHEEWKKLDSGEKVKRVEQQKERAGFIFSALLQAPGGYRKDVGVITGMAQRGI